MTPLGLSRKQGFVGICEVGAVVDVVLVAVVVAPR